MMQETKIHPECGRAYVERAEHGYFRCVWIFDAHIYKGYGRTPQEAMQNASDTISAEDNAEMRKRLDTATEGRKGQCQT